MPDPAPHWSETAVLYELNVETFQDSDGDGVGDFAGLTGRLPYLAALGVDAVWVQPFYPSPRQDFGYDVTDHCGVDDRFGTLADFDRFVAAARSVGLRVLLDIPFNHTSREHPWFQAARRDPNSPYRDYYVWADSPPEHHDPYLVFPGPQTSNWARDEAAGQFYFHTFYDFMPDLNIANPAVCEEILEVVRFWMRRGVHGFRLDALPFIVVDRSHAEHLEEPHAFLRRLRAAVTEIDPQGVLLAEADKPPAELRPYFGDGDEMHLLLNFYFNNHLYLALADGRAEPVARAWGHLPALPPGGNWANFLRNHDELSLAQLTEAEQERVFAAFAPQDDMQAYGRGTRRRLSPMLGGDPARLRLLYSLLFSLPGTPVLYYGDEIGLGDRLDLKERESVRTPMQWTAAEGAGFTTSSDPVRPFPEGDFSPEHVNVAAQTDDPASLLHFVQTLTRVYRVHPVCGRGAWTALDSGEEGVLAHRVGDGPAALYALHNFTAHPRAIDLALPPAVRPIVCAPGSTVRPGGADLGPHGFVWWAQEGQA
ncbi:alpha-amylase family protein [Deinococcus koreensis]|uniref:Trehalose synthase n=1 Tax=Deinococcus koreensis TaxID=2054903 RepID=A0A2K3UX49_9DEIO|nr:alpha-amylase family protein [Deinococcus koreensis]PNY81101.1 trehalose synthase [Deinococcus koreensis]